MSGKTQYFYSLRSDVLKEGSNSKTGSSTIQIVWKDINTDQSVSLEVPMTIFSIPEYTYKLLSGEITV